MVKVLLRVRKSTYMFESVEVCGSAGDKIMSAWWTRSATLLYW